LVFLIKNKAHLFGDHTLIAVIVWNTNMKSKRASEWPAPEPTGEVGSLPQPLLQVFTYKGGRGFKAVRTQYGRRSEEG